MGEILGVTKVGFGSLGLKWLESVDGADGANTMKRYVGLLGRSRWRALDRQHATWQR